jgi:hypothetical protein
LCPFSLLEHQNENLILIHNSLDFFSSIHFCLFQSVAPSKGLCSEEYFVSLFWILPRLLYSPLSLVRVHYKFLLHHTRLLFLSPYSLSYALFSLGLLCNERSTSPFFASMLTLPLTLSLSLLGHSHMSPYSSVLVYGNTNAATCT